MTMEKNQNRARGMEIGRLGVLKLQRSFFRAAHQPTSPKATAITAATKEKSGGNPRKVGSAWDKE
jgi:hypothetical protein